MRGPVEHDPRDVAVDRMLRSDLRHTLPDDVPARVAIAKAFFLQGSIDQRIRRCDVGV